MCISIDIFTGPPRSIDFILKRPVFFITLSLLFTFRDYWLLLESV
nr:MAG TPA: hypothetical protein [Caudoviricetes sp.]